MPTRSIRRLAATAVGVALLVLGAVLLLQDDGSAVQEPTGLPAPKQPIPRDPERLAEVLTQNTTALRAAVVRWRSDGDPAKGTPPEEVTLRGLFHQRIHLLLGDKRRLARATIANLRGSVAAETRDIVGARRALTRLAKGPVRRRRKVKHRTGRALPAGELLRLYRRAQRRFGVSWRVLAAVNLVETGFNRLRSNSVSDARGPMQFIPSTWRAYGLGGDVHDPGDAILGAANYLRASGAPDNYRRALYSYNNSDLYVEAVLRYARRMRRNPDTFYVLYSWQVFVRKGSALRRITGPRPR